MVYRYEVIELSAIVDIWSERPNSGNITYIEIKGKNIGDKQARKSALESISEKTDTESLQMLASLLQTPGAV